jgi:spore coat polysaccharide biosynthesis protein SpsF
MIAGKVAVVLQVRLSSVRLPGKALANLGRLTLLGHCVTRLKASGVGPVVVATTTLPVDDAVVAEARAFGVSTFRGDSEDVLSRILGAAIQLEAEYVIRATADNPAIDIASADRVLEMLRARKADHAVEHGLPYGCAVEATQTVALRDSCARATDPYDREHVTTFMRKPGSGFKCVVAPAPEAVRRPDLRFTVDTRADLEYMRNVLTEAERVSEQPASLERLIAIADAITRAEGVA